MPHFRSLSRLTALSLLALGCQTGKAFDRTTEPGGRPLSRTTTGSLVITGRALSADPGRTVLDAIRNQMPQLRIAGWTQYTRCPSLELRGKDSMEGSNDPDVYVDGTRTTDTCPLIQIQAAQTERVEVYPLGMTSRPGYPGSGHGLSVWFDSVLTEGVSFTNAPGAPELIYGRAFFPWSHPVDLAVGDTVSVRLQAKLVGADYVWRWDTRIANENEPALVKADYKQSTFFSTPKSPATLRKQAASHRPTVTEEGQIDQLILTLMDGATSLDEIARRVVDRFPARFADRYAALTRVGELSQKYSR